MILLRESKPGPSGLYRSPLTNCVTVCPITIHRFRNKFSVYRGQAVADDEVFASAQCSIVQSLPSVSSNYYIGLHFICVSHPTGHEVAQFVEAKRSRVRFPMVSLEFLHNPPGRTMALGSDSASNRNE